MIKLHITMTGKSYSPKSTFSIFNEETQTFPDIQSAKTWIRETYGKAKRVPMYVDTKNGTKKVGYVIGFHNADWAHNPVEKWIQRDWISFKSETTIYL